MIACLARRGLPGGDARGFDDLAAAMITDGQCHAVGAFFGVAMDACQYKALPHGILVHLEGRGGAIAPGDRSCVIGGGACRVGISEQGSHSCR